MTDVTLSQHIPDAPDQVWKRIGDFFNLADWHPAVVSSDAEGDGQKRRIVLADGNEVIEELVEKDDGERRYTYTMTNPGPLPLTNYKATLSVEADGSGSKVTWSGRFEPVGDEADARGAIENVYQAGFDNLARMFGGR